MSEDGQIGAFLLDDHEVGRREVHEPLSTEDGIRGLAGPARRRRIRVELQFVTLRSVIETDRP